MAILTCGPWTGLRVHDDLGREVVHIDACATAELVRTARQALECDVKIWRVEGVEHRVQAGPPLALTILRALAERG